MKKELSSLKNKDCFVQHCGCGATLRERRVLSKEEKRVVGRKKLSVYIRLCMMH